MDENTGAREPEEQTARTRRQWELSHGRQRQDWPGPLREPYEPTQDELGLLHSRVPGHRWNGWRRLTGDEGYYAACSCGWRSTETGYVSPMLRQVQEHLDAVPGGPQLARGIGGSAGTGPGRARERRQPARPAATARA